MAGGLGGLGGGVADYLNSPTGGNMLQALGFSLMSSPRNAPLQNFGEYYTGLKGQRMKQDALDLERSDVMASREAREAALIAADAPPEIASTLSVDPNAMTVWLNQKKVNDEKAANDEWFARNQGIFGGDTGGATGGLGGLGGAPVSTDEASGGVPVSEAPSATIVPERPQLAQEYGGASVFAEPGAAQTNANRFTPGGAVADTGFLEAAPTPGPGAEIPLAQPPANKTIDYLKANDPEAAALVDQGFSPRDAFEIAAQRQQGQKAFESRTQDAQAKLDSLYGLRERAANALMTAPKGVAAQAKVGLDNLDWQIERMEKQLSAEGGTDTMRNLQWRAEQAGLGPGTTEYQDFIRSGGSGNQNGEETFFGNPIAVQGADGSVSYGQIGNKGSFRPIELAEGQSFAPPTKRVDAGTEDVLVDQAGNVIARIPKDLAGAEADKEEGKARGAARVNLGGTLQKADQSITLIDQMLEHPGREVGTGLSSVLDPRNYMAGTDATDFNVMRKQLEGKAFLEAFESLKGGGQITEIEGQRATEAIARLSAAQSEEAYVAALKELRGILVQGKSRAQQRAGVTEAPTSQGGTDGGYKSKYGLE